MTKLSQGDIRITKKVTKEGDIYWMTDKKAEDQLKGENGAIFNNKEKISSGRFWIKCTNLIGQNKSVFWLVKKWDFKTYWVLKTAVKEKLASMECLIGKWFFQKTGFLTAKINGKSVFWSKLKYQTFSAHRSNNVDLVLLCGLTAVCGPMRSLRPGPD